MSAEALPDRRSSPRRTSAECAWLVAARLRPGREARVLDLSGGGALVETAVRLMPGTSTVLHLVGVRRRHTIRGTVLRCYVSALDRSTGVRYRAALRFEQRFPVPENDTRADGGGSG